MINGIEIVQADISTLNLEAIVNAANRSLLGGGGVDGAIHRAAGPRLLEACRLLNGCATGEAKITGGYELSAQWVIHTVGPVWTGGNHDEDKLLASCYHASLALAEQKHIKTIGFPCISTGAYGFPAERAARIAVIETRKFLEQTSIIGRVVFVCFDRRNSDLYYALLQ